MSIVQRELIQSFKILTQQITPVNTEDEIIRQLEEWFDALDREQREWLEVTWNVVCPSVHVSHENQKRIGHDALQPMTWSDARIEKAYKMARKSRSQGYESPTQPTTSADRRMEPSHRSFSPSSSSESVQEKNLIEQMRAASITPGTRATAPSVYNPSISIRSRKRGREDDDDEEDMESRSSKKVTCRRIFGSSPLLLTRAMQRKDIVGCDECIIESCDGVFGMRICSACRRDDLMCTWDGKLSVARALDAVAALGKEETQRMADIINRLSEENKELRNENSLLQDKVQYYIGLMRR